MRKRRPTVTKKAVWRFIVVTGLSFLLDTTAFVGTILLVERSYWTLAFLAITTGLWAVCVPMMADWRNRGPMIIGAVLGGWAAIKWT